MMIPALNGIRRVHFTGVGGVGMSALAQLLQTWGFEVSGSDRAHDQCRDSWLYEKLKRQGIRLVCQGRGELAEGLDCLVVSSAVEESNPEVQAAKERGLRILKRSDLLLSCVNGGRSIAVSGTGGKTTTAAMIAQIAEYAGQDPTAILGGFAQRYQSPTALGNVRTGCGETVVAEVDESDGSVRDFRPEVAVITNISKDHFDSAALVDFFRPFLAEAREIVLNRDCPRSSLLLDEFRDRAISFGRGGQTALQHVSLSRTGSAFELDGLRFILPLPGAHNVSNALAAVAATRCWGISDAISQRALAEYGGIERRWTRMGCPGGIEVVDDFAHSPIKIANALATAHLASGRVHAVFQPHGFGPTRFLWNEYLEVFEAGLNPADRLYLLDIYDAGGTADRSVSSEDLARSLYDKVSYVIKPKDRLDLIRMLGEEAKTGDLILVMGARDYSLSVLAREIVEALELDEP